MLLLNRQCLVVLVLGTVSPLLQKKPPPPPLVPRETLFGNPDRTGVKISPDGSLIAYLRPWKGVLNIWVITYDDLLQSGPKNEFPVTFDTGRGIAGFSWLYLPSTLLYSQDADGDENWKIYSLDVSSREALSPTILSDTSGVQASIYAISKKHPNSIVIGLNDRDARYKDLYNIDVISGERSFLLQNDRFAWFYFDDELRLRFAQLETDDAGVEYYRPLSAAYNETEWKLVKRIDFEDSYLSEFVRFDVTNTRCYWLDSADRDKAALFISDCEDEANKRLVYEPKTAGEISSLSFHPDDKTLLTVTENYDIPEIVVLNETVRDDWMLLKKLETKGYPHLRRGSRDFDKWLVIWISDVAPPKYYVYDRLKKVATYLFATRDALLNYSWMPMHPVAIRTRDGLSQLCYMTLPLQRDALFPVPVEPLPMVMFVHGGPWARDTWGFYSTVQWLANRGYAVMQCNYRGSTGFGKVHLNAGNGEWGGKMHTDLIDAVAWAVDNSFADKNKIAIYGGSYGGYAALVGLSFTPDVFACGVDIVGPSNLITLLESIPPYWTPLYTGFAKRIGATPDTPEGAAFLRSRSPLEFAGNIVKPLLIAQGANDPRVKKNESDQIVSEMQKQDIPVTYLLFPDEGHGFRRPENNNAFKGFAEEFLQKCLNGRLERLLPSVVNESSVQILSNGDF